MPRLYVEILVRPALLVDAKAIHHCNQLGALLPTHFLISENPFHPRHPW
jgi:hypothetical protein